MIERSRAAESPVERKGWRTVGPNMRRVVNGGDWSRGRWVRRVRARCVYGACAEKIVCVSLSLSSCSLCVLLGKRRPDVGKWLSAQTVN